MLLFFIIVLSICFPCIDVKAYFQPGKDSENFWRAFNSFEDIQFNSKLMKLYYLYIIFSWFEIKFFKVQCLID